MGWEPLIDFTYTYVSCFYLCVGVIVWECACDCMNESESVWV